MSHSLRVLMTGASGLIGGELAGLLAARGHAVTALTHRAAAIRRNEGGAVPSLPWAEGARPGMVALLAGDVRAPSLGLDACLADRVRGDCDLIVHAAAVTGFEAPGKLFRAVNVDGTAHVLALAAGGARTLPVLHVSTAYVCGEVSGPVAEHDPPGAGPFANGYEASKAEAEALAVQAGRDGVPVAIARPSIVVGAYADGAIRRPDGIYALIRLGAEGRVTALPARLGATLDLVPVDHVANGLLHLAEHMGQAAGRIVHLVSGRPVPVGMLAGLATEYPHLAAPRLIPPERFDRERLSPSGRMLHERVATHYATYLRRDPRFADHALPSLGGRKCPPTDAAFLKRLIDRCIATGYLRAA